MKTTFRYDHYYLYDELEKSLQTLEQKYPNLCSLESICVTEEGRNVYALTLTNKKTGEALSKPAFHVDGNTHAGEVTGSMAALHMADYLLTNYGKVEEVTTMLDKMTVYVVPRISPDGVETYLTTPYTIRSVNRVHNEVIGGVQEKDLDGDGVIRMMRIPTPYGAWKKDPKKDGSMVLRDPGDRYGEFYDIYPEGVLEKFDGDENLKMKKNIWALDFNRNYPYGWFPENRQPGAGKYPLSNPETKAMADWIIAHPNISCVSTNHTSGGMILYPPGTRPASKACPEDVKSFIAIANMGKEELGYEPLNIYDHFIQDQENFDSGAFDDWCYQSEGLVAFTVEYWDLAKRAGAPYQFKDKEKENNEMMIQRFNACMDWVKKNAPEQYVDWKEHRHPTFGKVELGGFNYKLTHQNPPTKFLKEVMEQATKFMIRFANTAPNLVIEKAKVKKLGTNVYEVTAIVGNTGYLPTNVTDEAVKMGKAKSVEVTLDGAEVTVGKPTQEIGNLSGYSRTTTGSMYYGNLTTTASALAKKKVTWVVKGKEGTKVTITAKQEKAGIATKSIKLK